MDDPQDDPQRFIPMHKLDPKVQFQLESALQNDNAWQVVASELQKQRYLSVTTMRKVTSAETLLRELYIREYTIGKLVLVLNQLKLEEPLMVLLAHEPIEITQQPHRNIITFEGANNVFKLECKASGFPYPHYQWLKKGSTSKDFQELQNQTEPILEVSPVRLADSGVYKCRVYNRCEDEISIEDSDEATVRILESYCTKLNDSALPAVPKIALQPVAPSSKLSVGSSFTLRVAAVCKHPVRYKWYKDKTELKDATTEELVIKHLEPEGTQSSWSYQCQVSTEFGDSVMSDEVRFSLDIATPGSQYTAKDKVALLIGNGDYKFLDKLDCAVNDVTTLSNLLTSLDFKVIALSNLNRQQMMMVIQRFCELLESGVYAVFYYVGHGYEYMKQCYMLPLDAPSEYKTEHAISADYVREHIQKDLPALCLMMLDMCRKPADGHPDIKEKVPEFFAPAPFPNTYLVYATTSSRGAYEIRGEPNGIFVKYLKEHITKDDTLKNIFDKVKKEIIMDPLAGSQQFPWEETNLAFERRLTDVIDQKGGEKLQERNDFFSILNNLPIDTSLRFDDKDISVSLNFYKHNQYLQNGLGIKVTVTNAENAHSLYGAFVTTANADVSWLPGYQFANCKQDVIKYNVVHNLQNLQELLMIDLIIDDINKSSSAEMYTIELGMPLIAGLIGIDS